MFLYKSLLNAAWFWSRARLTQPRPPGLRLTINKKNRNIYRYQTTNLLKTWFLFLVCKKGQKEDKRGFVTKYTGMILPLFLYKNISQIARKPFATQCFFTDHLNHKTVKKPVERPQHILADYGHISWKAFELLRLFFEALRSSWFIWQSIINHFEILLTRFLNNVSQVHCK